MKIIERGGLPEDKTYRATCRKCKTIFEYQQREAKFISDQRDGDCLKINCPVCNLEHYQALK